MKFLVSRTSVWGNETAPCKGATFERYTSVDCRTCKSFEEFQKSQGKNFLADGENHRVLRGPRGGAVGIARDYPGKGSGWFREFSTLDELIAFADEHGPIIVQWDSSNPDIREIEIYDGYRE